MESIEIKKRFDELVKKKEETKTQIVQIETRLQSTEESIKSIEADWKEKWDINSVEEAQQEVDRLSKEIDSIMSKCEAYLNKVGV